MCAAATCAGDYKGELHASPFRASFHSFCLAFKQSYEGELEVHSQF